MRQRQQQQNGNTAAATRPQPRPGRRHQWGECCLCEDANGTTVAAAVAITCWSGAGLLRTRVRSFVRPFVVVVVAHIPSRRPSQIRWRYCCCRRFGRQHCLVRYRRAATRFLNRRNTYRRRREQQPTRALNVWPVDRSHFSGGLLQLLLLLQHFVTFNSTPP